MEYIIWLSLTLKGLHKGLVISIPASQSFQKVRKHFSEIETFEGKEKEDKDFIGLNWNRP